MTLSQPTMLVVVTHHKKSLIATDDVQTTWHYHPPDAAGSPQFGDWMNNYLTFFNTISHLFSSSLLSGTGAATIEHWYIPTNPGLMGAPVSSGGIAPTAWTPTTNLPNEVAITLSLEADMTGVPERGPNKTRPAQRRRNRKYLGPLNVTTMELAEPTTAEQFISASARTTILTAYKNHMVDDMRGDGWRPVTFSKTDWADHPVVLAWVDNAFDTQRRRGNDATLRTAQAV